MRLDLDLEGDLDLEETIDDIEENYGGEVGGYTYVGAKYGEFLERGTRHMPPYSFVRPAVWELEAGPNAFVRKNSDLGGLDEADTLREVITTLLASLEMQMKLNATAQASGGRSPGTHPEHPKVQTDNLRGSISWRLDV